MHPLFWNSNLNFRFYFLIVGVFKEIYMYSLIKQQDFFVAFLQNHNDTKTSAWFGIFFPPEEEKQKR